MTPDGRASLRDVFAVARNADLSADEVRLWLLYRSYERPDGGGAFPGDELLAEHLGCSPRSVRRYRENLLDEGYLEQELRGPRPAAYRAVTPAGDRTELSTHSEERPDSDGHPSGKDRTELSGQGAKDRTELSGQRKEWPEDRTAMSPEYGEYKNTYTGDGEEQQDLDLRDAVEVVWSHYVGRYAERFGDRGATLLKIETANRDGKIRQRLRDGFTPEELCRAIDGCFDDPWHRDKGKHDLEYILRNESKALDFLNRAEENGGPPDERPDGRKELAAMEEAADG